MFLCKVIKIEKYSVFPDLFSYSQPQSMKDTFNQMGFGCLIDNFKAIIRV